MKVNFTRLARRGDPSGGAGVLRKAPPSYKSVALRYFSFSVKHNDGGEGKQFTEKWLSAGIA